MKQITKSKWLIISLSLLIGLSFSHCGKKKSGMLLLPELTEGQGGPGVSPENPKTAQEETTTQEEKPSIQVVDDTGAVDTGSTAESTSSGDDSQDSTPAVVEIPNNQIPRPTDNTSDNSSSQTTSDESNEVADNSSGSENQTVQDNNSSSEIQEAITDEDVAEDPQESTVASDTENTQTSSEDSSSDTQVASDNSGSTEEAISEEEAQEEVAAEEEEDAEEYAEIEESDDGEGVISKEDKEGGKGKGNCKVKVKEIDTSKGRWYNTKESLLPHPKKKDKFIKAKGIHTYWANQKLLVKVDNNCEGGKYKLVIVAKNHGKLPEWYHYFNVKVFNETTGENLGSMLIRASDKRYHRGKLIITLPEGESLLNIVWTNDAYKKGEYDANIQIKRIKIKKIKHHKEPKQILSRKGSRFCDTHGRWFVGTNPPSAYTYWAKQTISYCFRTKKAGKYEIIVRAGNAKRGLPLMPDYKEFKLLVAANGNSNYITIPAEQGKYHKGSTTLDLPAGDIVLNITWLNDKYRPPKYDANIEIVRVRLKRVGDIESPISAFLLQNPNITYKVVIPGIILILGALGMIYWLRKEKVA